VSSEVYPVDIVTPCGGLLRSEGLRQDVLSFIVAYPNVFVHCTVQTISLNVLTCWFWVLGLPVWSVDLLVLEVWQVRIGDQLTPENHCAPYMLNMFV